MFDVVAFVDLDLSKEAKELKKLKNLPNDFERIFTSITEAQKKYKAEVCFIYVASGYMQN